VVTGSGVNSQVGAPGCMMMIRSSTDESVGKPLVLSRLRRCGEWVSLFQPVRALPISTPSMRKFVLITLIYHEGTAATTTATPMVVITIILGLGIVSILLPAGTCIGLRSRVVAVITGL
jgi:hypothetical protein